ncbi:hypothetical protein QVD17_02912 [Tagetes erecta]|uniref:Uncharacterized protein n=1 Tax=Tagetes erecta TaxID=13708 RepID=A0AAD8LES8_TARER|nr:hypothetical protein QVD17_02912 [Tagetes erecta]
MLCEHCNALLSIFDSIVDTDLIHINFIDIFSLSILFHQSITIFFLSFAGCRVFSSLPDTFIFLFFSANN